MGDPEGSRKLKGQVNNFTHSKFERRGSSWKSTWVIWKDPFTNFRTFSKEYSVHRLAGAAQQQPIPTLDFLC